MGLRVNDARSNESAIITCLVSVLAVVYFAWNVKKSRKANAKLPPGPRGLPVVGYLPFLGTTDLHKKFTELSGVYGPIFKLWLGNKLCVVVSSPSLVKQVVRDQDTTFAYRDPPIAGLVATFGGNDIAWSNTNMLWGEALELKEKGTTILGVELKLSLQNSWCYWETPNSFGISFQCFSWLDIQDYGWNDTTTTMVEWTMAELMQHPQVMKKVQEELAQVVGMDSCVEEFHLPKLKYLDAVVKESFRLHPALPLLVPRRASESGSIGGYTIPKDTTLMLNVLGYPHRDPQLWDNPLEFRPERFLNVGVESKFDYSGNNFQYLPFGSGRRMCAGIPLAERMLMFVLASLLHSFEWELPAGTKLNLSEKFGIVIKKKEPLVAIPTPRLSNSELYH
ncbi:hypothetical protein CUMW_059290 [Citrus unshiu]|nr:hypothetical protein CUMW_059290 [Citrus unshiu]